jgi:phosphomannomutase/phosphoglucomutase
MKNIFREYDIRGIFEQELSEKNVKLIGYFLGKEVKKIGDYVALGYDARTHSPQLFKWLTSGFNASGINVLNMGLVATPVNYFANYQEFDGITPSASVMITGSHNPPEYNGFKITIDKAPFFGDDIYRLGEIVEQNQHIIIEDNETSTTCDVKSRYISYMVDEFQALKKLDKKVVFDCGNGVAGVVLKDIATELDLNWHGLYCEPDGTFPNHHPDPSVQDNLKDIQKQLQHESELGFAYDGDADRIAVLTKHNNIKGDELALIFAKNMDNPTVIGEVKCSQVMYDEINKIGKSIMYKTGHSNLKVKIKELNADLAAEVSGHIFFNDRYYGFDDAIYTTLRVLELIVDGVDLDKEMKLIPHTYSTEEIKIDTTEQEKFAHINRIKKALKDPPKEFPHIKEIVDIDGVRVIFEDGWGLVRASNTTPVIVTRFEATNLEQLKIYQSNLNRLIESTSR